MRFRASRPAAALPKRWLVYVETPLQSTVVEFADYVEAIEYAQDRRDEDEVLCIEVGDALGRVVWQHLATS